MINKQIAGIVLAFSVLGGAGVGVLADALTSKDETSATPEPTATSRATTPPTKTATPKPATTDALLPPQDLVISTGAVGPVKVGMSKQEALATGYFVADVKAPAEGCPNLPLGWKDDYVHSFDVYTLGNGEITSIGIFGDGILTDKGVGKGSTYDDVRAAYPDEFAVEAGYGQAGLRVFDRQDGGWIGFLFDSTVDDLKGSTPVFMVEVTKGAEPSLMRDGC